MKHFAVLNKKSNFAREIYANVLLNSKQIWMKIITNGIIGYLIRISKLKYKIKTSIGKLIIFRLISNEQFFIVYYKCSKQVIRDNTNPRPKKPVTNNFILKITHPVSVTITSLLT